MTRGLEPARTRDRVLGLAALVALPLALRVLTLSRTLALCDRWPVTESRHASPWGLSERTRRWLAHGRGPWTSTCLTRSVVLYAMLRTHGYAPRLHIGVEGERTSFVAHAWVTVRGIPVADRPETVARYRELLVHGA